MSGHSTWRLSRQEKVTAQLDAPAVLNEHGEHVYLSTGCLHDEHDYCQSGGVMNSEARGMAVKQPAQCKFCAAPCICDCHQQAAE